jgi:hypothetical protein
VSTGLGECQIANMEGKEPTGIVAETVFVVVVMTETVLSLELET